MRKKYPSQGDSGQAKLSNGLLKDKSHPVFEAIGTVDELNSYLGWACCVCNDLPKLKRWLIDIQKALFELGGAITGWSVSKFPQKHINKLEKQIKELEEKTKPQNGFILPDGSELASRLHIARTVCRRLERRIIELKSVNEPNIEISEEVTRFVNRLSDWLFLSACYANTAAGIDEIEL